VIDDGLLPIEPLVAVIANWLYSTLADARSASVSREVSELALELFFCGKAFPAPLC
jgi:hypothetical protein